MCQDFPGLLYFTLYFLAFRVDLKRQRWHFMNATLKYDFTFQKCGFVAQSNSIVWFKCSHLFVYHLNVRVCVWVCVWPRFSCFKTLRISPLAKTWNSRKIRFFMFHRSANFNIINKKILVKMRSAPQTNHDKCLENILNPKFVDVNVVIIEIGGAEQNFKLLMKMIKPRKPIMNTANLLCPNWIYWKRIRSTPSTQHNLSTCNPIKFLSFVVAKTFGIFFSLRSMTCNCFKLNSALLFIPTKCKRLLKAHSKWKLFSNIDTRSTWNSSSRYQIGNCERRTCLHGFSNSMRWLSSITYPMFHINLLVKIECSFSLAKFFFLIELKNVLVAKKKLLCRCFWYNIYSHFGHPNGCRFRPFTPNHLPKYSGNDFAAMAFAISLELNRTSTCVDPNPSKP